MRKLTLICLPFLLIAGCTSKSVYYASPNRYSERFLPLEAKSLLKIQEISSVSVSPGNPISLIKYDISLNSLTAISEQSGEMINFDVETGETNCRNQNIVFHALGFDGSGKKLLGTTGRALMAEGVLSEYLPWVAIFDVCSGVMVECVTGSCAGNGILEYESSDIGVAMDLTGKIIVVYGEYGYSVYSSAKGGAGIALVNNPEEDYWWHIGKIAVDSYNDRIAIVFQEGRIQLDSIKTDALGIFPLSVYEVLEEGKANQLGLIRYALFDQGGKWLAVVRGDELFVWRVRGLGKEVVYRSQIEDISTISFNPSGDLLFVGVNNKIKIFSPQWGRLIFELRTPNITALDISNDNRLLFWGDQDGVVHVWGILDSE